MQRNNLVAVLAISVVVFARSRPAVHGALGGQEVGATAEKSDDEPERNNERQRPFLAHTSVVLAGSRPAEKLSPEIGASTYSCLKA